MLGIQHTRSSAHHPTTRSAATAAAGPLRTTSKSKRRPSVVQKQLSNTAPTVQNDHETLAEAGGEDDSAWQDIPREEHDEDDEREGVEDDETGEVGEEQSKPALDGASEDAQRAGDGAAEQVKREGEGAESKDRDVTVNYTRHPSSPLSELSPAPDDDESPNLEEGDGGGEEGGEENTDDVTGGSRSKRPPAADAQSTDPANPGSLSSDAHATANASQSLSYPGLAGSAAQQATTASPFSAIHSELAIDGLPPSSPLPGSSSQLPHATSTPPTSSPGKPTGENAQAGPSGLAPASPSKVGPTQKFSILLELNAELFKVCQAFVASGYVPQETPEAQPFSKKLQSNLTWMSAHVDGVKLAAEVPEMDPPVLAPSASHIAFPDGVLERVSNLYAQLPVVFAKDIARRHQRLALSSGTGTPTPGLRNSATPSLLPPSGIGVKRERPDSAGYHGRESPSAAKRRDTGESKGVAGPSTPVHPGSAGSMDMRPPATPGFPTQSHSQAQVQMQMQMARPGSSMGGVRPMSSGGQASGSGDGMFPPNSSPGMGMGSNMQGVAGMGGLSPEAQARARQMQIRQAQAMMYQQQQQQQQQHQHQQQQQQQAHQQQQQQQQQQHQQHANQQQQNLQQHAGMQGGNLAMSPPQRQTQATPSPTQQQQMMQAQAAAARQMSPPGGGAGMGMGMNGSDGMGSSQQGAMSSNMSQPGMNMNGMGANTGSNMTLNPQMIASMGPAAMATYQILQNSQHPMTQYLNQQMPGFSQLPMMDQMRRFQMFQQQRQMAQGQRNQQMMANQMMGGQMRPPNANASGSGASQMQQLGQGGQMGMAPQMQSTNSDGGMQFPGTPTSANMPARTASSMGMSQQQMAGMSGMPNIPNMGNLNPQQRQLYLMQMQMRSGGAGGGGLGGGGVSGAGMNPSMMNPQMLAAAQERQRLEQQQQRLALAQRQGSPLNPAANNGRDQFPPGLRSNPNSSVGIARTGRSPSVTGIGDMAGAATPRIGGRMLPGGDDYQRSVLLQQVQRNAQMQQQQQQHQHQQGFMQGQGQGQGGWPGQQQSQQLPLSAGAWPQQNQQVFGMGGSPPNSGMQTVDLMGPPRQTSATPAPMGHHSPTAPSSDFDTMMNW